MATSTSSRLKSISLRLAENLNSISGYALAKPKRRGASHFAVKAGPAVTVSTELSPIRCADRQAAARVTNPSATPGASARPASVSLTARLRRWNTGVPKWSSRFFI
jgi:hypothetical protein